MSGFIPANQEDLLQRWLHRTRESQWGHYEAERSLLRGHYALGIPLVLLTAFTGTSVFGLISLNPDRWFKIVVGLTSVAAAVLSGLQTFLRMSDRAALHRGAAAAYADLRRDIEQRLATSRNQSDEDLTQLRERLSYLADRSPAIPPRVWKRTEKTLSARL